MQFKFLIFSLLRNKLLIILISFCLGFNLYSQIYTVGGSAEYNFLKGNEYDFISGNSKNTSNKFLEIRLNSWNLNSKNYQAWGVLTNLPKSYSSQFIFVPSYSYDRSGRPRPFGRGVGIPSWISLYGSFTEHNPDDWKKEQYNWPYGGGGFASKYLFKGLFTTVSLDILESSWKYGKKSYALAGSLENNLYQKSWSTHGDYFRASLDKSLGSIPGGGDPAPEFFIPDDFWNTHQYAHIQIFTSALAEDNPFLDVNYKTVTSVGGGRWHSYDMFIFPFVENGSKRTLINNSPNIYYFGPQGAYSGSEATFLSFAQDQDGDQLIYRWVDGTNLLESEEYSDSSNNEYRYQFKSGFSADKPLKENISDSDHFYINPYSGTVHFTNSETTGLRRNFVAIDQYKDGQLIGTIINQVPFISQSQSSSNNRPIIDISSSNPIAQKTSFDYSTDIPTSEVALTPPTTFKPYIASEVTRLRTPYTEVNNNGEVLLESLDAGEGEKVSIQIDLSDPNSDNIDFEIIPVDSDLKDSYPWTVESLGTNKYKFEWTTPSDLSLETNLSSKSYMFMLYAKDNNEVLEGLPGRTLKPVSITAHKRPSLLISSTDVNSGDTTNDPQINISISLDGIDNSLLSEDSFTLNSEIFEITNAVLEGLTKTSNNSYSGILKPDPSLNIDSEAITTSIEILENKISITKKGGYGINEVELKNKSSNLFKWTSNQARPTVEFQFFDSNGETLDNNSKTNDSYIVGKITPSQTTSDFVIDDLNFVNTNISSTTFTKVESVDETYYTIKIIATDNKEGSSNFSIPENVFTNNLGSKNIEGVLKSDATIKNYIWEFDRIPPNVTITNPFEVLSNATTSLSGVVIFSFSEEVKFMGKAFSELGDSDKKELIERLNENTSNAFFSDYVYETSSPNQFKLTLNHSGGNKTVSINSPIGFVKDLYGNKSEVATSTHSYNLDFPRFSTIYSINKSRPAPYRPYTYSQGSILKYLTSYEPVEVLLSFSGQSENSTNNTNDIGYQSKDSGSSFDINTDDISLSSGTLSGLQYFGLGSTVDESGNKEQLFRGTFTPADNYNGFVSFDIPAGKFNNVSGTPNIKSNAQLLIDTTAPTITFNVFSEGGLKLNEGAITSESSLLVEAEFSEPIEDFEEIDLIKIYDKFPAISEFTKVSDELYTFKISHDSGDGKYSLYNPKSSFNDKQGNKNISQVSFTWYYDTTRPSVEIELYNGTNKLEDLEYTPNKSTTVKYIFSESGISLAQSGDLEVLLNSYSENFIIQEADFDTQNQTINAIGEIQNTGKVTIDLPKNLFKDRAGNLNLAASQRVYYYDNSVPEPTIIAKNGASILANNTTFNTTSLDVLFEFSIPLGETYSDFTDSELETILNTQVSNGVLSDFQKQDSQSFSATLSTYDAGLIELRFPKDLVYTNSKVTNTEASKLTLNYDNIPPEALITVTLPNEEAVSEGLRTNSTTATVEVITTEISDDLLIDDFIINTNATTSNWKKIDDYTYSFDIIHNTSGVVSVGLNKDAFSDSLGNYNTKSFQLSYDFDNIRPVPTISSTLLNDGATTSETKVPVEITFSEAVSFIQEESKLESFLSTIISNGRLSDLSINEDTLNFIVNRVSNGLVTIAFPENMFFDTYSNGNTLSSFEFSFEGSITLSEVKLSSDNSLENDYSYTYTFQGSSNTREVPGTRKLLSEGHIDYLYVNNSHTLTLNLKAEADIQIDQITIDGSVLTPIMVNNNASEWKVEFPLSSVTTEGLIDFEIQFSDTSGNSQTPVNETTDKIKYLKDFTAPILEAKLIRLGNPNYEVDLQNEPLLPTRHSFILSSNEVLYEEQAFKEVKVFDPSSTFKLYRNNLARFAGELQTWKPATYHNSKLWTTMSTTIPEQQYNGFGSDVGEQYWLDYDPQNAILFPNTGAGTHTITVPQGYFMDFAGNETPAVLVDGLKLQTSGNTVDIISSITKKSCENTTKASYRRLRNSSYTYTYFEDEVIVELSTSNNWANPSLLSSDRIRIISSSEIEGVPNLYLNVNELKKEFELDLEESTWVRFKTVSRFSKPLEEASASNSFSAYSEYFQVGKEIYWTEIVSYSDPFEITVASDPIKVSGVDGICGLNKSENFTINTSGGSWSTSDTNIASIDSSTGVLTTLKAGVVDVLYTTSDSCVYLKTIEVFNATVVQIEANGQTEFCEGSSVKLTSSVSNNLTWYKDGVAQTHLTSNNVILNDQSDSGTYYLSYQTPCGPVLSNEIVIQINALPQASKIKGNEK